MARLLLLIGLLELSGCSVSVYPVGERASAVHRVQTRDGWQVALHQFPARAGVAPARYPVIVCHGVSSNRRNWDLDDRLSLPLFLSRAGFDVYLLELRGGGEALKPGWLDPQRWDYSFDDYVLHDLPAAVDWVRDRTGAAQIHWVGHSMGGIVMYGYLQRVGEQAIRSMTAVASPPLVFNHNATLSALMDLLPWATFFFDRLPGRLLSQWSAPWAWPSRLLALHIIWNDQNMDPEAARRLAANGVDDISGRVFAQLERSRDGHLRSADGAWDYTEGMAGITVPSLFLAGAVDQLAPPAVMYQAYRAVRSSRRRSTPCSGSSPTSSATTPR